jgi:hypothetical protein
MCGCGGGGGGRVGVAKPVNPHSPLPLAPRLIWRYISKVYLGSISRDVYSCAPQLPTPRMWTRITRALLVSKDRRHLFALPGSVMIYAKTTVHCSPGSSMPLVQHLFTKMIQFRHSFTTEKLKLQRVKLHILYLHLIFLG